MLKTQKSIVVTFVLLLFLLAFLLGVITRLLDIYQSLSSGCFYYLSLILITILTVKKGEKQSLDSIGVDFYHIIKKITLGIGIFAILTLFHIAYVLFGVKLHLVHLSLLQILILTLYNICLLGFAEELIFRGYLLERFNELLKSKVAAVIFSSLLFGLWHYPTNYYFGQVIFAFLFGIVLSTIKLKTKGKVIVSLAIAHGLFNSCLLWLGYFMK
ncbi:MAG: CPBP family intramembrane metalloprotease [Clostridia bacterium]|nr:CPBP family intramembrane metalloprotease [Clostridia bacterium]